MNEGVNHRALIGLGSNINPENNISEAIRLLKSELVILALAPVYQTPAVGSSGPDYLNSAVLIQTDLSPEDLRQKVLSKIENQLGRVRSADKYMDRTIDLDILVFDQTVVDGELWTQAHIALPAAQILPDQVNLQTGEKISQAAERLLPGTNIKLRSDLS